MKIAIALFAVVLVAAVACGQEPAPKPVNFAFEDQFDGKPELSSLRGRVVVLVYGDRKGMETCRQLGEQLHTQFHPTAKGLKPAEAQKQPVLALPGLKPGQTSPELIVVPVACCGKVPGLVRTVIRSQVKANAPDVPVWLDFEDTMTQHFGLTKGEPNLAVFDANGVYRHAINGTPDAKKHQDLLQLLQNLRAEAVK